MFCLEAEKTSLPKRQVNVVCAGHSAGLASSGGNGLCKCVCDCSVATSMTTTLGSFLAGNNLSWMALEITCEWWYRYREVIGWISLAIITSTIEKGRKLWKPCLPFLWPVSLHFPSLERSSFVNTSKIKSHVFSYYKWQWQDLCVCLKNAFTYLCEVFTISKNKATTWYRVGI